MEHVVGLDVETRAGVEAGRGPVRASHRQPRRIGRVRQVGPPEPFSPISPSGIAWTSHPAASSPRRVERVAVSDDHDARSDREDVAAQGRVLGLRDLDEPDLELAAAPQPNRQERQEDDREVVGDR